MELDYFLSMKTFIATSPEDEYFFYARSAQTCKTACTTFLISGSRLVTKRGLSLSHLLFKGEGCGNT